MLGDDQSGEDKLGGDQVWQVQLSEDQKRYHFIFQKIEKNSEYFCTELAAFLAEMALFCKNLDFLTVQKCNFL